MNFKPLGDRVLVERQEEEKKTASGLIIPDSAKEKPAQGKVVAISKSLEAKAELKVGDLVCFGKYSGTEITLDGKEYIVLQSSEKNSEIIGILN